MTEQRIGVLMGGTSPEHDISLASGRTVASALQRRGYDAVGLEVQADLAAQLLASRVGLAFLALHGPGGEDGQVQGLLETLGIPYTGSGVLASALGMHKLLTRTLLRTRGIPVPATQVLHRGNTAPSSDWRYPVVVKPCCQGSTIGVSVVRSAETVHEAVAKALAYDQTILIEEYLPGREVTVGLLDGEPLPTVEVLPRTGLYDYAAKYTTGMSDYRVPALLPAPVDHEVQRLAVVVYQSVGAAGAARVDFRVSDGGAPAVLEINTIPGMTETSLLPMAAQAAGMSYEELVERMVASALRRQG